MNLMFLGPPGAGKGTVASRLAEDKGIPHISTGDIFRAAIRDETDLGKKVKAILDRGDLVPDELTVSLVRERLSQPDAEKGYILDGFPRTIGQADALGEFSSLDKVLNFQIPDSEVVKRLSGRRIHKPSGRTYHIEFNPPKVAGKDDVTGEDLIQRPDDTEEAIKNRLEVYKKQTAPLIEYYENKDLLINVDATGSPDEVYGVVLEIVQ
jgi:adenylate kinase